MSPKTALLASAIALWAFPCSATKTVASIGDFDTFVAHHGRQYQRGTPEYDLRRSLFESRLAEVNAQNAIAHRLWTAGINTYTDRTEEERSLMRGWKPVGPRHSGLGPRQQQPGGGASFLEEEDVTAGNDTQVLASLPDELHWKSLQGAAQIKEQGMCGSCWAVTTTTMIEAHYEIHMGGKLKEFSTQELVNCVPNPNACGGTGGCDGATVELAMAFIQANGLSFESAVPYKAETIHCARDATTLAKDDKGLAGSSGLRGTQLGLVSWETLPSNKEAPLAKAVVEKGPVAVSVAASKWFSYSSGIFDACPKDSVIDHAVTLYGYGKEGSTKYWLIRNSWGSGWGESGFIRLLRHNSEDDHCGTDDDPQKGIACKDGPPSVTVCGTCGVLYDSVVPTFSNAGSSGTASVLPTTVNHRSDGSGEVVKTDSAKEVDHDTESRNEDVGFEADTNWSPSLGRSDTVEAKAKPHKPQGGTVIMAEIGADAQPSLMRRAPPAAAGAALLEAPWTEEDVPVWLPNKRMY